MGPRHYVVVIHGMGEQKLNETAVNVALRFAEVRAGHRKPVYAYRVLRTHMSSQSVRPATGGPGWAEFDAIPVDPDAHIERPFDGRPPTPETNGSNFRFVDLGWAPLLHAHQARYGESTQRWTQHLVRQLEQRPASPAWARLVLDVIRHSALQLERVLSLRSRRLATLVFRDFLGDVHLYGDYARTRGRAVRQVHVSLDELIQRDFVDWCRRAREHGVEREYELPRLTLVAHSLGSVLAFDALSYANLPDRVRCLYAAMQHECESLPFLGYDFERDYEAKSRSDLFNQVYDTGRLKEFCTVTGCPGWQPSPLPAILWRRVPTLLITLGSPIDKYLELWPGNYAHLDDDGLFMEREHKIQHINLADENDPVGHHLEVAASRPAYRRLFTSSADVVFRRYHWPLAAHQSYWQDTALFADLLHQIDARHDDKPLPTERLYRSGVLPVLTACLIIYIGLPVAGGLLLWWLTHHLAADANHLAATATHAIDFSVLFVREAVTGGLPPFHVMGGALTFWLLVDPLPLLGRGRPRLGIVAALLLAAVYWRRIAIVLSRRRGFARWGFDLVAAGIPAMAALAGVVQLLGGDILTPLPASLWTMASLTTFTALVARFHLRRR